MRYALGVVFIAISLSIATAATAFQEPSPSPKPVPSDKIPKCRSRLGERHLHDLKKNLPEMISELEKLRRRARHLGGYLKDLERDIADNPGNTKSKEKRDAAEKDFNEAERERFEKEREIERAREKIKELESMDPCELP